MEYIVRIFKNYRDFLTPEKDTEQIKSRGLGFGMLRQKQQEQEKSTKRCHPDDAFIQGHGFVFNHENFVASHK